MDVFEKLRNGLPVNMASEEYKPAFEHIMFAAIKCHEINNLTPDLEKVKPLLGELFEGKFPNNSYIMRPMQLDFPKHISIGENVFINHHFTCMGAGGITIGSGCYIGPNVTIVTTNHDLNNLAVLKCKNVNIGKNVWFGANVLVLPGITVGDNSVLAGGAVITKDVAPNTIVGGNPAKVLKTIEI